MANVGVLVENILKVCYSFWVEDTQEILEKFDLLPKPSTQETDIPRACSGGKYTPDVILRNDGFNAGAVYTADSFYMNFANLLGNMARMRVDGLVVREKTTEKGSKAIEMLLLYDQNQQLTNSITNAEGILQVRRNLATPLSVLHTNPESWSWRGALPDGTEVVFKPVYEIPVNYTSDAEINSGETGNNSEPAIVIGYGSRGVVNYAYDHFKTLAEPKSQKTLADQTVREALKLAAASVSTKINEVIQQSLKPDTGSNL